MAPEDGEIGDKQEGADAHMRPLVERQKVCYKVIHHQAQEREQSVYAHLTQIVRDIEVAFAHYIRKQHQYEIACRAARRGCHIAHSRHEKDLQNDGYHHADDRKPCSVLRLVGEFVPKTEVEIHSLEDISPQHDGYDPQPLPIGRGDDVFEQIKVEGYPHQYKVGKKYIVLHGIGIRVQRPAVLVLGEDKRFVGITERLREHHHDHGDLEARAVDTELRLRVGGSIEEGEEDTVEGLIHDAEHTQHQQRQGIAEHAPQQGEGEMRTVPLTPRLDDSRQQAEGLDGSGKDIRHEDIAHPIRRVIPRGYARNMLYARTEHQEEKVECDIEKDKQEFEYGKAYGAFLVAKVSEGNACKGIQGNDDAEERDELAVVGVAEEVGNGLRKDTTEDGKEQRSGKERAHGGDIHRVRIVAFLVGKAEETRLHAIGEDDEQEGRPSVEVGDDTIVGLLREDVGIERHKEPVEEPADDGRKPVDDGLLRQYFH